MPLYAETQFVNESLSRVGCRPVASLDAPFGPQGQIPRDVFNAVKRFLLGAHQWEFTKTFGSLTRYGAGKAGWESAFVLPPARVDLPTAYYSSNSDRHPIRHFEIYQGRVHVGHSACWAEYRFVPTFEALPSFFTELMQVVLMSEWALAIREDRTLRRELRLQAFGSEQYQGQGGQFAVAMALDAHGAAQKVAPSGGEEVHILRGGSFNTLYTGLDD